MMATELTIRFGFLGMDLFPNTDAGIDVDTSIDTYAEMVTEAIEDAYPGAQVSVEFQRNASGALPFNLRTAAWTDDGERDDVVDHVDRIAEKIWTDSEWYMHSDAQGRVCCQHTRP